MDVKRIVEFIRYGEPLAEKQKREAILVREGRLVLRLRREQEGQE